MVLLKLVCPLCPGRHTCYNGQDKGSPLVGLVFSAIGMASLSFMFKKHIG